MYLAVVVGFLSKIYVTRNFLSRRFIFIFDRAYIFSFFAFHCYSNLCGVLVKCSIAFEWAQNISSFFFLFLSLHHTFDIFCIFALSNSTFLSHSLTQLCFHLFRNHFCQPRSHNPATFTELLIKLMSTLTK